MRITAEICFKGKPPFYIPVTYRRNIVSLIREAIRSADNTHEIYSKYWGNTNTHSVKPFTFFLSVPDVSYIDFNDRRLIRLNDKYFKLYITSSDSTFLSILHKWLSDTPNKSFNLFNYNVEIKGIILKEVKTIHSSFERFKILSPAIVRDVAVEGRKRKSMGYLSCNNPDFEDSLAYSIITLCRKFLHSKILNRNDIELDTSLCVSSIIYHYMETIPVTIGIIGIKADDEVLELIYNAGLGARRSQGFGMVDLLTEADYDSITVMEELA
ncbi:MAG: CRISPR-associated endoribonuclease Cas6 [Spirochaetes bacterium]|nr:CRISPR-associated endoribonuclease Cas6 [Spirochaetota bacterium]